MATNYQELIKIEMFDKEWVSQETLLSAIARKKHGIAKAGDKKKGAVLIALKSMYRKGVLKKEIDEDGDVFWGKRLPGDEPIVLRKKAAIQIDPFELTRLTTARKNIRLLEEALRKLYADVFEDVYGSSWEKHLDETTYEILKTQYWKSRHASWKPGGHPEELFSAAGIKDFSHIMGDKNNRDLFRGRFPSTFVIAGKLAELAEYRNRIQHNEALSKEEYLYFNIATQLLMQKMV
ncbi:MAG: hypothetical protein KGJ89_00750 [Patescibacteria group bacterium]|nr:hypothetical protein [Patescibacteria group bacterium]MDE2015042.1 hypothetical protein [Patescibacteria group bacterium]MDE2226470.1 hypothetical protein [Patescibacteria group bacterium]